jgi:ABC-type Fe3+-hydroxamate transport system substrate-binding protein
MEILNFSNRPFVPPARRIVSLVPSLTELLAHLALEEETVGITKFCVHPHHWFKNKDRMGGTKDVRLNRTLDAQPDLVIASKEENVKEQVELIAQHAPVLLTDIADLQGALEAIEYIGGLCNRRVKAAEMVVEISRRFEALALQVPANKTAAYLIWKDPYMAAGGDTYINSMMQYAGFTNVFAACSRYPETDLDELAALAPALVLLSSEPYPFGQKHLAELSAHLPHSQIRLVDGEMFSWYGSRLLLAPAYFSSLHTPV